MPKEIRLVRDFSSPAERVFAALDDHENMGRWLGPRFSIVKRAADGGVGTVRRVHNPLFPIDEEILEREVPSRLVYKIIRGAPGVSYHRGEIRVEPQGQSKSRVTWHIEVDSPLPGFASLLLRGLSVALRRGLKKLDAQLAHA